MKVRELLIEGPNLRIFLQRPMLAHIVFVFFIFASISFLRWGWVSLVCSKIEPKYFEKY